MSNKKLGFTLTFIAAITVIVPLFSQARNSGLSQPDDPEVLAFEVTPSGFNPSETTVHQGKSLIVLRNLTGRRDLEFWVARENEGRVSESKGKNRDWNAQVRLNPGTYILGETNHPEWRAVIRVTN